MCLHEHPLLLCEKGDYFDVFPKCYSSLSLRDLTSPGNQLLASSSPICTTAALGRPSLWGRWEDITESGCEVLKVLIFDAVFAGLWRAVAGAVVAWFALRAEEG